MTAIAPAAPVSVATAVANPANAGKPVTIYSQMVHTNNQRNAPNVPQNEYRLTDQAYALMRHPGSPVYIPDEGPSVKLTGVTGGTLDALIAAEMHKPGPFQKDAGYNAALVAVQGVLTLGKGPHDHSLAVSKIDPANYDDLKQVQPQG